MTIRHLFTTIILAFTTVIIIHNVLLDKVLKYANGAIFPLNPPSS